MEKKSRQEFKELSEEQLMEVTGGRAAGLGMCDIDLVSNKGLNPRNSLRLL